MSWRCVAEYMAPAFPGAVVASCDATGDSDRGAEGHTAETTHPTISGPHAAERSTT